MIIPMFRIMEVKRGFPYTLFHSVNGSRQVPMRQWVTADEKPVHDGSNGTEYISGFHCLPTVIDCMAYIRKFSAPRELGVYAIETEGLRPKFHSRDEVYLASHMYVKERVR
jgi:hypothetical protein